MARIGGAPTRAGLLSRESGPRRALTQGLCPAADSANTEETWDSLANRAPWAASPDKGLRLEQLDPALPLPLLPSWAGARATIAADCTRARATTQKAALEHPRILEVFNLGRIAVGSGHTLIEQDTPSFSKLFFIISYTKGYIVAIH
ncbi:hypothetical protein Y1Q_0007564 [Alligator mississippiensis]|uniref:Uncharacterized protein n=1 Tax=Alligator mississippiensis TaxID=8496 RepID=A0A151P046_ALLMI|nr:hypothetical protein Y1Q_0007564 [Alligator mississippiensis]